jgi:succinyl-CoA synthetase alpha subunit
MIVKGIIRKGEYYDSVTLMMAARKLREISGVLDSAVVMGTPENRAILEAAGLTVEEFGAAADADLLIAVKAEDALHAERALAEAESVLKSLRTRTDIGTSPLPRTMEAALRLMPDAKMALISVAGRYAFDEAMRALRHGLHVMLFSDNVALEQEIALKRYAVEHGLLVMGPDCGTAIINGAPLAFANAVNRGNIGIVAAAGTGLQEVSCLISNAGAGISQAIGTGGRDVKEAVGGLMFLQALHMLAENPETKIIVAISKPPHDSVLKKIAKETQTIRKPVVAAFLGADPDAIRAGEMLGAGSLHEAALMAIALSESTPLNHLRAELSRQRAAVRKLAKTEAQKLQPGQKYARGLFSGGTFCYEAQTLLHDMLNHIYSNAPTGKSQRLSNSLESTKHTLIDLGEDEFTVGRPHPMIDYSLRNQRIIAEANDPETAVILLDVVLGYGSNPDPLTEIVPAISAAQKNAAGYGRHLLVICSVTGTDSDPQNRSTVAEGLRGQGVIVAESNSAACRLAGYIVQNR